MMEFFFNKTNKKEIFHWSPIHLARLDVGGPVRTGLGSQDQVHENDVAHLKKRRRDMKRKVDLLDAALEGRSRL